MTEPNWLDSVLAPVIKSNDPSVIAQAIAHNPRFLAAIKRGLERKTPLGIAETSYAQSIAKSIVEEFSEP